MITPFRLFAAGFVVTILSCRGNRAPGARSDPTASPTVSPPSIAATVPSIPSTAPGESNPGVLTEEESAGQPSEPSRCSLPAPPGRPLARLFASARRLKSTSELAALKSRGKAGAPERVAIGVEGTFGAGCECPPFSAWFSDPDQSFSQILALPGKGVFDISTFRTNLSFIVVGYFSGASIDMYEYFRGTGQVAGTPDEEESSTWRETHPEFCLEALCYWIPDFHTHPGEDAEGVEHAKFLRGVAVDHAANLAKRGVPRCQRDWMRDL